MTELTAAQQQADFLTALAEHLRVHPHLVVFAMTASGDMYLRTDDEDPRAAAGALVAWFASVGATDLWVRLYIEPDYREGYAAVHAHDVTIGGQPVRNLWGTVRGLQRWLVQGAGYGHQLFTLAELEHFAEHATLPEAGER